MTSNSGVSSGATSRAIHGIVASSSSGALYSYSVILYKYQILYNNVMTQLLPYMEYFSKADSAYNDNQFNQYVSATFLILDSLWGSVPFQKKLINLQFENDELQTYKKILEDPVLLQNYINERNINVLPFQATSTFNTQIIIKPWFAEYFKRYGPPADGYFRTDLLTTIVMELITNKIITEEDFLQG
jgi:hypothetical protein